MIDLKELRENPDRVKMGIASRNGSVDIIEKLIEDDKSWRTKLQQLESMRHKQKTLTPKGKPSPEQMNELKTLSASIKEVQEELNAFETEFQTQLMHIPNIPADSTPVGKDENENKVIRTMGEIPSLDFTPRPHEQLAENLNLIDFELAAKIAGARFAVYKDYGARLERAVGNFMIDHHTANNGYSERIPPVIVNTKSMTGTGQLPKFADDSFKLEDTDYWLSPTAEVQLTNLFRDTIVPEEELPVKVAAYTACFRKEAGSYGKDLSGIIRQHQFGKVELVKLSHPDESFNELEALTADAESILQALGLPYRVVELCTGDLGFSSAKTYDIEVWFPAQNKYREISSCSNFLDFQSRRAMIRYKSKISGNVSYLHTLNGSGLAVGRTVAALLENFQTKAGSVKIPEVLQPQMGIKEIR